MRHQGAMSDALARKVCARNEVLALVKYEYVAHILIANGIASFIRNYRGVRVVWGMADGHSGAVRVVLAVQRSCATTCRSRKSAMASLTCWGWVMGPICPRQSNSLTSTRGKAPVKSRATPSEDGGDARPTM